MTHKFALRLVAISNLLTLFLVGCQSKSDATSSVVITTTKESLEPFSGISGYVVLTTGKSRVITSVSLPELKVNVSYRTAAEDAEVSPTIHSLSGPDSIGRIAYVEDHYFGEMKKDEKHLLKTIKIDGSEDTEIFSRPGNAMWATSAAGHGEIGHHVALAPTGGMVAILSGISGKQMPLALLKQGQVELWDVDQKRKLDVTVQALDEPMSWFPDGKRLAYVRLVPRANLPERPIGLERFGNYFDQSWDEVPAIYILDIGSGESQFAHIGWNPIVSLDGKAMLVGGWDTDGKFSWNHFDLGSRESKRVQWGGESEIAIALMENIVISNGLGIDVARLNTKDFQTIIKEVDRFANLSFGKGPVK